jgi:hypothetical protein
MRQVGHDQCMHPAADDHVVIQLSRDEALVLYELLHRWEEHGQVAEPEHHAERVALWNLSATLERELAEPFDPACRRLVTDARMRLADRPEPPSGAH